MARTRIGVDVGSSAVRVAEVAMGDIPVIVRAAQVPLAPGVVESGEVRQSEAVAEALRKVLAKSGVKSNQVHLGVGNQRVVVREIALPWLPEEELRDTLSFQVQEFIPMASDEVVLDFDPLGELDQGGRRMVRILLVAAHKGMVDALVEAALAAKLDPQDIDLTPFAVIRAIGTDDEGLDLDSSGEEAVIDIGAQVTSICVHDRGVTRFVRMLPFGGRDITLALASRLGVDDEVAERLKRGDRVQVDGEGATPLPEPAEIRELALTRAESFVDEIRSSLEFYTAQMPNAQIGGVLVVGGGSRLDGLLELLQERLPVPVDRGRLFERAKSEVELSAEASTEAEAVLSVAVGLAIPTRGQA
ncbi:MAG TPA: type IV pilus assembly protein PilM [Actinomycetota bacterium]